MINSCAQKGRNEAETERKWRDVVSWTESTPRRDGILFPDLSTTRQEAGFYPQVISLETSTKKNNEQDKYETLWIAKDSTIETASFKNVCKRIILYLLI